MTQPQDDQDDRRNDHEAQDGPQDATSAWTPPSDPLFDDVLTARDPLGGPDVWSTPSSPSIPSTPVGPPLPGPPLPDAAPAVPAEPAPSTWLPTPLAASTQTGTASPQDLSPTTPPYTYRPPLDPPPAPPTTAGTPSWAGRPRPRRRGLAALAAVVAAIVVVGAATVVVRTSRSGTSTTPRSTSTEPPLGQPVTVAPAGASPTRVGEPTSIRLEIVAAAGTTATVRYDGDNKESVRLRNVALPWAVEAPLNPATSSVSVTASDSSTAPRAQRAVLLCRVSIGGVLVSESLGRGSTDCSAYLNRFRSTRSTGDGAALTGVAPATPSAVTLPTLPTTAASVTVEAYSSTPTSTLSVRFGSAGSSNKVDLEKQSTPFARRAALPAGADLVSLSVSDYDTDPAPTLMCRILLDGVPVETIVSPTSASCSISVRSVLGS